MKIGIIQTRGIGDIVIALPIARHFVDAGHAVVWPIYEKFIRPFRAAAPYVEFVPLPEQHGQWMFTRPLEITAARPIRPDRDYQKGIVHVFIQRARAQER